MIKGVRGVLFALLFVATRLDCANALARPRSGFSGSPNPRSRFTSGSDKEAAFAALELRWYNSVENIVVANKRSALWKDPYGSTLLHRAVLLEDSRSVVPLLVSQGAKLNALDKGGRTALYYAISRRNFDAAEYLVKQGANIYRIDAEEGSSAFGLLMRVARPLYGREDLTKVEELLQLLLERGADITEYSFRERPHFLLTSFRQAPRDSALFDTLRYRLQNLLPEAMEDAINKKDLDRMASLVYVADYARLSEERYTALRAQLSAILPSFFKLTFDSMSDRETLYFMVNKADYAGRTDATREDRPYQLLKLWRELWEEVLAKQLEEMQKARLDDSDNWYG
uniref:Uncharacterized protein n=1 Tax=Pinguiococcus pyrenoidosus TaxID=172671 RepID=A0A7R9UA38_9STRA